MTHEANINLTSTESCEFITLAFAPELLNGLVIKKLVQKIDLKGIPIKALTVITKMPGSTHKMPGSTHKMPGSTHKMI